MKENLAGASPVDQPVRPRAWWRLSIYAECWPCVTVDEKEAEFWRSEGLTVVELGDVEVERDARCMFVARLENMRQSGDKRLTPEAVLAILSDCDMLAQRPNV